LASRPDHEGDPFALVRLEQAGQAGRDGVFMIQRKPL
jgi:hypothetical protein